MSCRYRQLLYCTRSMRNIGAEFLTVLSTYLEPRAFAADNAWPLRMLGHWLGFPFLMTPSSSMRWSRHHHSSRSGPRPRPWQGIHTSTAPSLPATAAASRHSGRTGRTCRAPYSTRVPPRWREDPIRGSGSRVGRPVRSRANRMRIPQTGRCLVSRAGALVQGDGPPWMQTHGPAADSSAFPSGERPRCPES